MVVKQGNVHLGISVSPKLEECSLKFIILISHDFGVNQKSLD